MPQVFFKGPAGRIEGFCSESVDPTAPIALILNPRFLHGESIDNNVINTLYTTLFNNNFTTMKINFRGVGRSEGKAEINNYDGEKEDAAAALDWMQVNFPASRFCLVAGFSFGAWIAMQLATRRPEITNFIAVSPPVSQDKDKDKNKYDFSFLSPCPMSGLIVQGEVDSIFEEKDVASLVKNLQQYKCVDIDYRTIAKADHFFRGKINLFQEELTHYLENKFTHQKLFDNNQPVAQKKIKKEHKKRYL